MSDDLDEMISEQMNNPIFKEEFEVLESEFKFIQAMIDARKKLNLTHKQFAERLGIKQTELYELETGNRTPSLALLNFLAISMNRTLKIDFIPKLHRLD